MPLRFGETAYGRQIQSDATEGYKEACQQLEIVTLPNIAVDLIIVWDRLATTDP